MGNGTTVAVIGALIILSVAIGGALGTIATGNGASVTTVTQSSSSTASNSSSPFVLTLVITTENTFNSTIGTQPAFFVLGSNGLQASSNITIPAHRLIKVVIMNFDQGNASLTSDQYAKVTGTVNNTVNFYNNNAMNATEGASGIELSGGQIVSSLDALYVSHTFTVPQLGLNIPIATEATEIAYFTTGGPGSYTWLCNTLCGSEPGGAGGAMVTTGWMAGVLTVA